MKKNTSLLSASFCKTGFFKIFCLCFAALFLFTACSGTQTKNRSSTHSEAKFKLSNANDPSEIVLYSLGLLDTGYVFGGSNPSAGLDCSGMVSYVVKQVSGRRLPHNAAQIAAITQPISKSELRPADLVFFNTDGKTYSHMGIYLGDGKFIHAPSSKAESGWRR